MSSINTKKYRDASKNSLGDCRIVRVIFRDALFNHAGRHQAKRCSFDQVGVATEAKPFRLLYGRFFTSTSAPWPGIAARSAVSLACIFLQSRELLRVLNLHDPHLRLFSCVILQLTISRLAWCESERHTPSRCNLRLLSADALPRLHRADKSRRTRAVHFTGSIRRV